MVLSDSSINGMDEAQAQLDVLQAALSSDFTEANRLEMQRGDQLKRLMTAEDMYFQQQAKDKWLIFMVETWLIFMLCLITQEGSLKLIA